MGVVTTKAGSGKLPHQKAQPSQSASASTSTMPPAQGHGSSSDVVDMVEEIGLAVATGLIPVVGQGINIYDTVECLLRLRNSKSSAERMEAKFDLVLALVGWIPGAGGGVKKTIRIVNKHPDRYAPVLFDVLRMVLAKLGIQTSPEMLLAELFDAAGLRGLLATVQTAIEESWLYAKMPAAGQLALSGSMRVVEAELPAMVLLVATKLTHWKTKQRNNASHQVAAEKKTPTDPKPDKLDKDVGTKGGNAPNVTGSSRVLNAKTGLVNLEKFTKEITGILGEHITDYFCLTTYQWGTGWSAHDRGIEGSWLVKPDRVHAGKVSDRTKLNKLFQGPHGTGLDGVWKVDITNPHNRGKKYAVVESKASVVCDVPLSLDKPKIEHKLGDNRERPKKPAKEPEKVAVVNMEKLLEPDTCDLPATLNPPAKPTDLDASKSTARTQPAKVSLKKPTTVVTLEKKPIKRDYRKKHPPKPRKPKVLRVQMSHVWIELNMLKAVGQTISEDVLREGYSRHLLYTPFYLASAMQHAEAFALGIEDHHEAHINHEIDINHRYVEDEIMMAVNAKNAKIGLPPEQ